MVSSAATALHAPLAAVDRPTWCRHLDVPGKVIKLSCENTNVHEHANDYGYRVHSDS